MTKHAKKLICMFILGTMLLLLTGCEGTGAISCITNTFFRLASEAINEGAEKDSSAQTAAPMPAETPESTEAPALSLEEDELPWVAA